MPLHDIFELTLKQTYGSSGEELINNFFYKRVGASGTSSDLVGGFVDTDELLDKIHGVQADFIKDKGIRCINLGNLADFNDSALTGNGTQEGSVAAPAHEAISFSLKIDTRALRPGGKRIAGLANAWSEDGVITNVAELAAIETLRLGLAGVITGTEDSYVPVVIKRIRLAPDLTHTRVRYRLPESDGELVLGNVTSAVVSLKVSHQVSRGNGR